MCSRYVFAGFLIVVVSITLSGRVAAQGTRAVEKTFHIGGDGGWDYVTLDAKNHRLYVFRSNHTMVIDADTGTTVAGILSLSDLMGKGSISSGEIATALRTICEPVHGITEPTEMVTAA